MLGVDEKKSYFIVQARREKKNPSPALYTLQVGLVVDGPLISRLLHKKAIEVCGLRSVYMDQTSRNPGHCYSVAWCYYVDASNI